jgi:hypothetical protein
MPRGSLSAVVHDSTRDAGFFESADTPRDNTLKGFAGIKHPVDTSSRVRAKTVNRLSWPGGKVRTRYCTVIDPCRTLGLDPNEPLRASRAAPKDPDPSEQNAPLKKEERRSPIREGG